MAGIADIAGAAAPAASLPLAAADGRTEGTQRPAQGSGTSRSAASAKTGDVSHAWPDATGTFDENLDAALPEDEAEAPGVPKVARLGKTAAKEAESAAQERTGDAVPVPTVLMPWTFVQPVDAAPQPSAGSETVVENTSDAPAPTEGSVGPAPTGTDTTVTSNVPVFAAGTNPTTDKDLVKADTASARHVDSEAASGDDAGSALADKPTDVDARSTDATPKAPAANLGATPQPQPADEAGRTAVPRTDAAVTLESPQRKENAQPTENPAKDSAAKNSAAANESAPAESIERPQTKTKESAAGHATSSSTTGVVKPKATAEVSAQPQTSESRTETASDALSKNGRAAGVDKTPTPARPSQSSRLAIVDAGGNRETDTDRHVRIDAVTATAATDERHRGAASDGDGGETKVIALPTPAQASPQESAPIVMTSHPAAHATTAPVAPAAVAAPAATDAAAFAETPVMTAGDVPDPETPNRLVQSLRMQFMRGGGDAIVELRPEHLGPVTVSLRVEHGAVEARITAANPVVAEWLQAHQDTLREGLQANGLTLDRLFIDKDGRSPDRRERRDNPQRQRFRHVPEAQSTFELTI